MTLISLGDVARDRRCRRCGLTREALVSLALGRLIPHVVINGCLYLLRNDLPHIIDGSAGLLAQRDLKTNGGVPKELETVTSVRPFPLTGYEPAVYFLCRLGRVLYVGQSTCLARRIGDHLLSNKFAWCRFSEVFYLPTRHPDLCETEAVFIKALRPPANDPAWPYNMGCGPWKDFR